MKIHIIISYFIGLICIIIGITKHVLHNNTIEAIYNCILGSLCIIEALILFVIEIILRKK